jgi:hypothetical protein
VIKKSKLFLRVPIVILLLSYSISAHSQDILALKLDGSEQGKSLSEVLAEIENKNNAKFFFLPEWISSVSFAESHQGQTLEQALAYLFIGTELNFFAMYPGTVVIVKDAKQSIQRKEAIQVAIREKKTIEQYVLGDQGTSTKGNAVLKGKVIDSKTGDPLSQVNIYIVDLQVGAATDQMGNYSLAMEPGIHVLNISSIDYEPKVIDLAIYKDGQLDLELEKMARLLDEVVVQDGGALEISESRIGETQITMSSLKLAPALMGEVDIIKQIQNLPGVTTVGEAATGFNVRGGSVDQNLILYDGLPVSNSSHVFGLFSSFNPEAVRNASLYRGGIPAEYGGRASSILDIKSKDGSYEKWNGNAGIGLITSNLMINGPLQKGKTSLAASFRSTYSDWLIRAVRTDYVDLENSSVFFYDGTLKLTHKINDRTKISATGYSSKDSFTLDGDTTYQWKNLLGGVKLDYQISAAHIAEFSAGVSSYSYNVLNSDPLNGSELSFRLTSSVFKAGFNYQHGNHQLNYGWQLTYYQFNPGSLKPTSSVSSATNLSLAKQYSVENALYLSDNWAFQNRFFVDGGLRFPMFAAFGPSSINVYKPAEPLEISNVMDTLNYSRGEISKMYFGIEPRLTLRWMAGPKSSIKFGYSRVYQYLQLITNSTAVTPVDIWQPSGYYFKPQRADQVSLGYFISSKSKIFEASAEVFYKSIGNIIDFKDGAELILNPHLETELLQGKGEAYGIETLISKNTGRFTWSMNYTYSRAFRIISGPTAGESINNGKQYPANYDQPHIANLSWKYNLSRRYFFTGNFTYHTGRPVTVPLSAFASENTTVAYFSERNSYRIPDYHRLDLALVIEGNHKRKKIASGTWVFSVYNVYARKNPYTVFFKNSGAGIPKPYQLSIIGTIFPSISYNVKF